MYIKIADNMQEPYSVEKLRRDNPNVSFPRIITDDLLSEYFVYPVTIEEQPVCDHSTQVCVRNELADDIDGRWVYRWTVRDRTPEEAELNKLQSSALARERRNNLLAASDWTQVLDAPVDQTAWAVYRRELRDITSQEGFPQDINWPTKP